MRQAIWPESSSCSIVIGQFTIDIGNARNGYFLTTCSSSNNKRKKIIVQKENQKLQYDLSTTDMFPLQFGSGLYNISFMENTVAKKYQNLGTISIAVKLDREDASFLLPNQYVNYNKNTPAVLLANNLCADITDEAAVYKAIKMYVTKNFRYDYLKASTVKPGMLPDINTCFEKKSGICQDLSALVVCMLRSQGIAARFVIGYADKIYHAWVRTKIDGKKYLFDPTAAVCHKKVAAKYVEERFY